jgi:hypothetical protein
MPPCDMPHRRKVRMRNVLLAYVLAGILVFVWTHTPAQAKSRPHDADAIQVDGAWTAVAANTLTALPAPHVADPNDPALAAVVQVATGTDTVNALNSVGWTSFRLHLLLNQQTARNVYTIYTITMPPAWQTAAPFGADIGGCNPAFWAVDPSGRYDSWLTVGFVEGDAASALSTVGIPFETWTSVHGLVATDGAVFWPNPDSAPGGEVVVAQITVPEGSKWRATLSAQGRSVETQPEDTSDWTLTGMVFDSHS